MKKIRVLGAAALVAAVATCGDVRASDVRDPRVRDYVSPVRVVATFPQDGACRVADVGKLLEPKRGQVCETRFGKAAGTRLANGGEPAGFLLDFGRELHGGVQLGMSPKGTPGARLRLRFGESIAEAMSDVGGEKNATNDHAMRDFEVEAPSFGTIEAGNTGFRFVRIDLVSPGEVGFEFVRAVSLMRPMARLGGFRCSDERLNRIFETAARTVHLCCQDYLWDGIKRDRLVWIGDMHPEERVVAAVFGAQPVVPDSIDYLAETTPPDEWMNTIGTYTLWWIRCLADWYRYTGDRDYLAKHAAYLKATFANLENYLTPSNTFDGLKRVFLDWPTEHNKPAVFAGTQALALLAWRDGAFLADALGDADFAARCRGCAARLETQRGRLEPHGSKQAAALLALSGLREPGEMFRECLGLDGTEGVATFYGYYMIEAMCEAGERQAALDTVRDYWGAMLDVGATSFWEDFSVDWTNNCFRIDEMPVAGKVDIHGDHGEFCYSGFRHSLCHGWSGGPAAWCINRILGLRPQDPGCRTVEFSPFLGDLDWAEGALALPDGGSVKVSVRKTHAGELETSVSAPPNVKIVGTLPTQWAMGNGEWGTGNGEREMGNGKWGTGNGKCGDSLQKRGDSPLKLWGHSPQEKLITE